MSQDSGCMYSHVSFEEGNLLDFERLATIVDSLSSRVSISRERRGEKQ